GSGASAFQLSVARSYSQALSIGTHAAGPDCGSTNPPNAQILPLYSVKETWCEASGIGFFFVHLSPDGSYSYTMPIGFHPGASPQNTYILPPAEAPSSSSAGSGNAASFVHFPWARTGPTRNTQLSSASART